MRSVVLAIVGSLMIKGPAVSKPNAIIDSYIGRTLLLHVADDKSVVLDIYKGGKLRYVDARTFAGDDAPKESYVRTVRYRITDEEWFCVARERETCFELPSLKDGEYKRVKIKAYTAEGTMNWSGEGALMLLPVKPTFM